MLFALCSISKTGSSVITKCLQSTGSSGSITKYVQTGLQQNTWIIE
jgi:LPS sulfotransferase NodH